MSAGNTIAMKMADGQTIGVYHAEPEGARRGGLVAIQEIFGVTDHIKSVCDAYAADGYEVLAPSLFDRQAPGFVSGYTPEEMQKGAALAYGAPLERRVADAQACIDALKGKGPVFIVGYCFGGSVTWAAACRCTGLAAASSYYGKLAPDMADEAPQCPAACHFGKTDASIPLDAVEKLRVKRPEVAVYLYDAGHAFNNSDRPEAYHEASATLARERTLDLFRRNGG
ncbi:MAG: dienelactone hydrolase family protein [Alphaproteobacteria bacterium]|nr:dienelactone hydrolase family protein [Alphaproteobacteria bacterium]MDE2110020.1 dienelactone hydrolase family protein [Alphaproteobacteria bacterium]MDE2492952.1 dienelactone hydrolase family protein [Alphaproteobacteria bacterium]